MPNGRPGDHPYTDIVHHGEAVYSGAVDDLVRKVAELSDERGRRELASLLLQEYNDYMSPDVLKLQRFLERRLERLRAEASDRGWDV
jgi:hypothetical protein